MRITSTHSYHERGSDHNAHAIQIRSADGRRSSARSAKVGVGVDWGWSPDSQLIAFQSNSMTGFRPTDDLWVMRANGSRKQRLTQNRLDDSHPS